MSSPPSCEGSQRRSSGHRNLLGWWKVWFQPYSSILLALTYVRHRHHAQKAQASGFCYVADCVLAILILKRPLAAAPGRPLSRPRVMYLDLDLHFSDGVSQAFFSSSSGSASPQVLTLSIHHTSPGFFPISDLAALPDPANSSFDPFTLSLPLERGASNGTFRRIWSLVADVKEAFEPDYVVVQCGADGLAGDPYAIWNWSLGREEGSLGWCIEQVRRWGRKTLFLGGGNEPYDWLDVVSFADALPTLRWLQLAECISSMDVSDFDRGTASTS